MKNSIAIALLLGASVQAIELEGHRKHKHHDSPALALKKRELAALEKDMARVKGEFRRLKEEEENVDRMAHLRAQPISVVQARMMAQNHSSQRFASGYNDADLDKGEKMGVDIGLKDHDITGFRGHGVNPGLFDVHVAQKQSRAQTGNRFAAGYADEEDLEDHMHMINWEAAHPKEHLRKYRFAQQEPAAAEGAAAGAGFTLAGPGGPALPAEPAGNAPLAEPRGEKEWQQWAQEHVDWLDNQVDRANTRLPYASTFVQTGEPVAAGSGYPNTLADDQGAKLVGKPGLPSQSTITAAPEKEWQQWAQDFVDWEDGQTDAANTRLPYASTLVQLQNDKAGAGYPNTLAMPGPNNGYPGLPTQTIPNNAPLGEPYGEKEWQGWAQDFVDWEDNQADVANARLPYASTLLQTGYDWSDPEADQVDAILMEADGPMDIENMEYRDVPLNTELVHIGSPEDGELVMVAAPNDDPSQMEDFMMEDAGVPLNMRLLQLDAPDDDPANMEQFIMEDSGIPLNMRL